MWNVRTLGTLMLLNVYYFQTNVPELYVDHLIVGASSQILL